MSTEHRPRVPSIPADAAVGDDDAVDEREGASAVVITDGGLRVLEASGEALVERGHRPRDWPGRELRELVDPESWRSLAPHLQAALAGEHRSFRHRAADGTSTYRMHVVPLGARDGGLVITITDISRKLRSIARLARSEARLREAERIIGVGSWELMLAEGWITYSPGFASVLGLIAGEPLSVSSLEMIVRPADRTLFRGGLERCLRDGSARSEFRIVRPDGALRLLALRAEAVTDGDTPPAHLRGAILDITAQREADTERAAATALFAQAFDAAPIGMGLTTPSGDRYIRVNDAMCALLGRTREELMRSGVRDITHPDDRERDDHARRALLDGDQPDFHAEKRYVRGDGTAVWATVHVAPVRNADGSVGAFIAQKIDITEAKEREAHLARYVRDAEWLGRVRDALDQDRFVLYAQPIVDLGTGEIVQRELLLRMRDDAGGIVDPGHFLPVAERYGLIGEVDCWVIRQAVRLASRGPVQFNLSAASIGDPSVIHELELAVRAAGVDPARLVVEVTETALMRQPKAARAFAARLSALGCALALDDFGTGYASLSYLKHLPAQWLKIDREFVTDLRGSETDARVVRGVVGLAREFGQRIIAEGIEDQQTAARLREFGVELGQGYLFARPAPVEHDPGVGDVVRRGASTAIDRTAAVRAAFQALADRDRTRLRRLCASDVTLRLFATPERVGREPYRGHVGLDRYLRDVEAAGDDIRIPAGPFWEVSGAVIAAGRVATRSDGTAAVADVLWVCRFRDGLITSIDAFRQPDDHAPELPSPAEEAGRLPASE